VETSDVDLAWQKSRQCSAGACVEIAGHAGHVYIRDSKYPAGARLRFTRAEWDAFVAGVKADDFVVD
jgi:Domain of unknown function (DUF397)